MKITFGSTTKAWLDRGGTVLGLAGLIFVALRLRSYAGEIDWSEISAFGYLALVGLVLIYGVSNFLLAFGWWRLIRHLNVSVSRNWALRAYAISQLAKYVPGNIFQFAGRQAIGVAAGIGNKPLAKSTALELVLLIIGGVLFVPLAAPKVAGWAGVASFVVIATLALWLAARVGGAEFGAAARLYLAFLILSGAIFVAAYEIAGGNAMLDALPVIGGAYVVAWLAGLVTPGAPAGLGVREAVLLFLLGGLGTAPVILLAVIVGRVITVLGDLGFYLVGTLLIESEQAI